MAASLRCDGLFQAVIFAFTDAALKAKPLNVSMGKSNPRPIA